MAPQKPYMDPFLLRLARSIRIPTAPALCSALKDLSRFYLQNCSLTIARYQVFTWHSFYALKVFLPSDYHSVVIVALVH